MHDVVAELAERGRLLQPEDRARLVELLVDSMSEAEPLPHDDAWKQEIRRRVAAYERGEAILYDADEVLAEAERLAP